MIRQRTGIVRSVQQVRPGFCELLVEVEGKQVQAGLLEHLTGPAVPGDRVVLNTTARHLGLGTGGMDFVLHVHGRGPADPAGAGHIMKLRYTPLQIQVLAVEEADSPYRSALESADNLQGHPVVVAGLHSLIAPIAAAIKAVSQGRAKVLYVMTDGAALPLALSGLWHRLRTAELVDGAVTIGHAFGGDLEAVNVYSGLLAARYALQADVTVVSMGPGVVGTGTTYGTTALEVGQLVDAVGVLGGQPVVAPRISFADPRARHQGLSHHTVTALTRIAHRRAQVVLPVLENTEWMRRVRADVRESGVDQRHDVMERDGLIGLECLEDNEIRVTSMGRKPVEDPAFFLAGGAAGRLAAESWDALASRGKDT